MIDGNTDSAWEKTDGRVGLTATAYNSTNISTKDDFAMEVNGGKLDFYKDIDIVNMKVSDGEIVAHLGDANFTWGNDIGYGAGKNSAGQDIDVMTYYPGHYIKRWQGPNSDENLTEYIQLSMWNFDGAMYIEPYYRGTFEAIADTTTFGSGEDQRILRSYAGASPQVSTAIGDFRKYAKNNPNANNKMSIGDWRDFDFLCLYLIKYADYNSQDKVGRGYDTGGSIQKTGVGDAHITLNGRDGYLGTNGETSVWCLGLCNPWGNVWEFVDGITINNHQAYIATNPSNYHLGSGITGETNEYKKLGYLNWNAAGWASKVGCDYNATNPNYQPNNQLICFPNSDNNIANDSTGICDYYYQKSGTCLVFRGGAIGYLTATGAFSFRCDFSFGESGTGLSCRLLKTA